METALYLPVKRFLENLGFTVKGEVGGCDLVALGGDEPPIVVVGELKLSFNLELLLQAVDWPAALARDKEGRSRAARIAMMAITTNSSMSVKPNRRGTLCGAGIIERWLRIRIL